MNKRLLLLLCTLSISIIYTGCNSVYQPEPDDPDPFEPPVLQSPKNNSYGIQTDSSLQWMEVPGASYYTVQVATDRDFTNPLADTSIYSTTYRPAGLKADSVYYWRVATESTYNWSETWRFSTSNEPGPGTYDPPALTLPENGADEVPIDVALRWDKVPGADSYDIQVATNHEFTDIIASHTTGTTSFEPEQLESGTTYFWRVSSGPESGWSEVWSFTTSQMPDTSPPDTTTPPETQDIWVSAYLASWNHYAPPGGNWGHISANDIDWDAFTHLIYFAMSARADGSLSSIAAYENISPDRINAIVSAAHKHNKPVLISIGGWGNYNGFSRAITPGSRARFVNNLVSLIKTWGFDGIDLDMEPINSSDVENYKALVRELHAELQKVTTPLGSKPLLTAATSWSPGLFSDLQQYFDQINLMTYDYSGAWEGWVSWHNSSVYDGGLTFPGTNRPLPSIHGTLQTFINAGIAREKLGVGIDFYGYVWNGYVTDPGQSLTPVAPRVQDNVPYHTIMNNYYSTGAYRWDDDAQAAYLHIASPDPSRRKFISYDDERSVQAKIDYTRQQKIGGVIIWELGGGYRSDQPAGSRDLLLQTVKNAVR